MRSTLSRLLVLLSATAASVSSSGYDEKLARHLLVYASIAVQEPEEVESWKFSNGNCMEQTMGDEVIGTWRSEDTAFGYAVVNHRQKYIRVAFKGSNDTEDWVDYNLRTLPFSYPNPCRIQGTTLPGHVHTGFCSYYSGLAELGMGDKIARTQKDTGYPVTVIGHSLGGAAAAVHAVDLITRFKITPTLYTYGEPRVGDPDFADTLSETGRDFRVVHKHDPVPHVAKCCMPGCRKDTSCPYHHNTEVFYDNDMSTAGDYKTCTDESKDCANGNMLDVNIKDHTTYFGVSVGGLCKTPGTRVPN